jgi:hypothetical protein
MLNLALRIATGPDGTVGGLAVEGMAVEPADGRDSIALT